LRREIIQSNLLLKTALTKLDQSSFSQVRKNSKGGDCAACLSSLFQLCFCCASPSRLWLYCLYNHTSGSWREQLELP